MPCSPSGIAACRSSPSTRSSTTAAESTSSASAIRLAAPAPAPRAAPARRAAAARARRRGRPRAAAARPRGRACAASSDSVDATTAATRKTSSATQFSASAIVNRPVGGMWKKLKAQRRRDAGRQAEPQAPERRDEQHREQVQDAERDRRGDLLEREQQRGRERHRPRRDETPRAGDRPLIRARLAAVGRTGPVDSSAGPRRPRRPTQLAHVRGQLAGDDVGQRDVLEHAAQRGAHGDPDVAHRLGDAREVERLRAARR